MVQAGVSTKSSLSKTRKIITDMRETLKILSGMDIKILRGINSHKDRLHAIANEKEFSNIQKEIELIKNNILLLKKENPNELDHIGVHANKVDEIRNNITKIKDKLLTLIKFYKEDTSIHNSKEELTKKIFRISHLKNYKDYFNKVEGPMVEAVEKYLSNENLKQNYIDLIHEKATQFNDDFLFPRKSNEVSIPEYIEDKLKWLLAHINSELRLLKDALHVTNKLEEKLSKHILEGTHNLLILLEDRIKTCFNMIKDESNMFYDPLNTIFSKEQQLDRMITSVLDKNKKINPSDMKEWYRLFGVDTVNKYVNAKSTMKEMLSGENIKGSNTQRYQLKIEEKYLQNLKRQETEKIKKIKDRLKVKYGNDELTGLPLRKVFLEEFNKAIKNMMNEYKASQALERREKETRSALIAFDADWFKNFNSVHGHAGGDIILIKLAEVISSVFRREEDVKPARYGGEEFISFLNSISPENAIKKAEELRMKVESILDKKVAIICKEKYGTDYYDQELYDYVNKPRLKHRKLTVSIGVFCFDPLLLIDLEGKEAGLKACEDYKTIFGFLNKVADDAGEVAKKRGKNKVICANFEKKNVFSDTIFNSHLKKLNKFVPKQ